MCLQLFFFEGSYDISTYEIWSSFSLIGLYLWFTYLGNVILRWVKKKEKWYDRHILTLKTLYHRFSENKNIILIVFIINVFVWVIVNINIIEYGNLSSSIYGNIHIIMYV